MGCIRYDKSLTITNMQLIITGIRFCKCHTGNIWSNVLICVGVRKPSDRICCGSVTKREVSPGVITKVRDYQGAQVGSIAVRSAQMYYKADT